MVDSKKNLKHRFHLYCCPFRIEAASRGCSSLVSRIPVRVLILAYWCYTCPFHSQKRPAEWLVCRAQPRIAQALQRITLPWSPSELCSDPMWGTNNSRPNILSVPPHPTKHCASLGSSLLLHCFAFPTTPCCNAATPAAPNSQIHAKLGWFSISFIFLILKKLHKRGNGLKFYGTFLLTSGCWVESYRSLFSIYLYMRRHYIGSEDNSWNSLYITMAEGKCRSTT